MTQARHRVGANIRASQRAAPGPVFRRVDEDFPALVECLLSEAVERSVERAASHLDQRHMRRRRPAAAGFDQPIARLAARLKVRFD